MRSAVLALAVVGCSDELSPPTGEQVKYVLSGLTLPQSNTTARQLGLDLNGDGTIDNQLGTAMGSLTNEGADPSVRVFVRIAHGDVLSLATLQYAQASDPDDSIAFTLFEGSNPVPAPCTAKLDTTCRHHLQGDGQFVALPALNQPLLGERMPGRFIGGPGRLAVSIPLYDAVVYVELLGARVRIYRLDDTSLVGLIGGGLTASDVHHKLVPAFQSHLEQRIAAECSMRNQPPSCGCVTNEEKTDALTWIHMLDTNPKDCMITNDEISNNSLVGQLIAPDIEIDGVRLTSLGFGFEAVRASF
ncbi:MAG TPA: hypothetical protein VIV11_23420 [Kofleriaceae bacterium]